MSAEWPLKKLSEVAEFLNYKRVPLKSLDREKRQGNYPYYGASGVVDHIDDFIFDGTFLLISEDGENLRTRKTPIAFKAIGKFWVNNHAHILAEKEEGILDYLEYYFAKLDLSPFITGAVQPKLNKANLDSIAIPIPPREERLKINRIFNSFTNKIELNRQTNQTLEQIAQAIFKSWFIEFEPTRAKIAAKNRWQAIHQTTECGSPTCYAEEFDTEQQDQNIKATSLEEAMTQAAMAAISGKALSQLSQHSPEQQQQLKATADLFPGDLVDSPLGEVPEGWDIKPLDQIAHYQNGLAMQKFRPDNDNEFLPVLKIAQFKKGYVDGGEKASPYIKSECIVNNGDVIFSWSASLLVDMWCGGKVALNQHLFKVTSVKHPKWFYLYWTKYHLELFKKIAADKAVTMGHIKRSHLSEAQCAVPNTDLADFSLIGSLVDKQVEQRLESFSLMAIRDSMLPKLLSGELPIHEAQQQIKQ
ncbi:MAG: restriction endonuclease subunit S [Candidatus Reddybacter sp.]